MGSIAQGGEIYLEARAFPGLELSQARPVGSGGLGMRFGSGFFQLTASGYWGTRPDLDLELEYAGIQVADGVRWMGGWFGVELRDTWRFAYGDGASFLVNVSLVFRGSVDRSRDKWVPTTPLDQMDLGPVDY
jgi:hypothetical protein